MTGVQTCALRSEEHTSELQSHDNLVCRLLLEKKNHSIWSLHYPRIPPPQALKYVTRLARRRRRAGEAGGAGPRQAWEGGKLLLFFLMIQPPPSPPPRPYIWGKGP